MCLGIPGKVVELFRDYDVLMGKVDFASTPTLKSSMIASNN